MSAVTYSRRTVIAAAAAAPLLISGCAGLVMPDSRVYSGRFSLKLTTQKKTETAAGKYRLVKSGDAYELDLMTPLSGVLGRVYVTPTSALVERNGQEDLTAPNEEILMREAFGFSLPVAVLADWLEGKASPRMPHGKETLGRFTQAGWTLQYVAAGESSAVSVLRMRRSDPGRAILIALTVEKEN